MFATLQFFNFIQQPLTWFPRVFATLSNVLSASDRLQALLAVSRPSWFCGYCSPYQAEEQDIAIEIDHRADVAVRIKGDFHHESASDSESALDTSADVQEHETPFSLRGIDLDTHRGELFHGLDRGMANREGSVVCIVGRVGSGKTTLLSGLIGDVKRGPGTMSVYGGRMAYVPQAAWIQSGSIQDNITFGSGEADEAKLASVSHAAGLQDDLANFQDGIE